MSRPWTVEYYRSLEVRLREITADLLDRLEAVVRGRVAPEIDNLTIGSGRHVRAAVLFFDIRGFSSRTGSSKPEDLKAALAMLDCVIPMIMHVIHDHDGYVEKNTGDGVMAIFGIGETEPAQAETALDAASAIESVVRTLVNPRLQQLGIRPIDARIGIDLGEIIVARIGVPTGAARQARNFLTAVGPAANLACKIQQSAGTNEIWVGDRIKRAAPLRYAASFVDVTPPNWAWTYDSSGIVYRIWRFTWISRTPGADLFAAVLGLLGPDVRRRNL